MTGILNWDVNKDFIALVNAATMKGVVSGHKAGPRLIKDTTGVYIKLTRKRGKPLTAYAIGADYSKAADKDAAVAMIDAIADTDEFNEEIPMEYLSRSVDHECSIFTAKFTLTKVSYSASGVRKGAKHVHMFDKWFQSATLINLKQMVAVAIKEWDCDEAPPAKWETFKKDSSRAKLIRWIKEEFNDVNLMRELFAAYDERVAALPAYNHIRKTRNLPQVDFF